MWLQQLLTTFMSFKEFLRKELFSEKVRIILSKT